MRVDNIEGMRFFFFEAIYWCFRPAEQSVSALMGSRYRLLPIVVVEGTGNARYESALEIVQAIQQLRLAQAEHAAFADELADIKGAYRAKRNFMRLLVSLT